MSIQKLILLFLFELFSISLFSQHVETVGIYGGFNIPVTFDTGLDKDPRYLRKFVAKGTPVGIHYEYGTTNSNIGLVVTPSYLKLGQKYFILNKIGGEVGIRNIDMSYFSVPVGVKYKVVKLSFLRINLVAGLDFCLLLNGRETISHISTLLRYPPKVSVPDSPDYRVVYDGVYVPDVKGQVYVDKDKYRLFQLFGSFGLRGDFDLDVEGKWTLLFEAKLNYGLFDSRKNSYLSELKNPSGRPDVLGNPGATDLYGARHDSYVSVICGISRVITTGYKLKTRRTPRRKSFEFEAKPEKK